MLPLLQFVVAVAVIGGLQLLFYRTALGRAFRATSDDQSVAQLMGLDNRHVFALAMALSLAVVAVAGVFLAVRTNFDPAIGPARLIFGFEAVIIGGLGSLWGTLAGGIMLGVAQAIGAQIDPGWQLLAGHLAFLLILAVRPEGLFPKVQTDERAVPRRARHALEPHRHRARSPSRWSCSRRRRSGAGATTCGCSPRSTPMSRWRACGICSPAMPGLVSVGQQAYVGLGAYVLFALDHPGRRASARRRSRSRASSRPWSRCRSPALMFRLRGHYFAIGTWVVAEVFRLLASQISALGGGSGISLPAGIVTSMASSRQMREFLIYWVALALVVVVLGADRAAAALALRPGAHRHPRQRARGALERRRRRRAPSSSSMSSPRSAPPWSAR